MNARPISLRSADPLAFTTAMFCLVFAAVNVSLLKLDVFFTFDRLDLSLIRESWPLLQLAGSSAAAVGGWAILRGKAWGHAPACMGVVLVIGWVPDFHSITNKVSFLLVIGPGIATLVLLFKHRAKRMQQHGEQGLPLEPAPQRLGRFYGCFALVFGLAGTWFSYRLWAMASGLRRHWPKRLDMLDPDLISWIYPLLFLALATAAFLRLENRPWSRLLALPSLALIITITWLLFGLEMSALPTAICVFGSLLLVLAVIDALSQALGQTPEERFPVNSVAATPAPAHGSQAEALVATDLPGGKQAPAFLKPLTDSLGATTSYFCMILALALLLLNITRLWLTPVDQATGYGNIDTWEILRFALLAALLVGGVAIRHKRGWGFIPAAMGLAVTMGILERILVREIQGLYFTPMSMALALVVITRFLWAMQGGGDSPRARAAGWPGMAQGGLTVVYALAGSLSIPILCFEAGFLSQPLSQGILPHNSIFMPWIFAALFAALLLAAHLRLKNQGKALPLAVAAHALLMAYTGLVFGQALTARAWTILITSSALLVLAVADGLFKTPQQST